MVALKQNTIGLSETITAIRGHSMDASKRTTHRFSGSTRTVCYALQKVDTQFPETAVAPHVSHLLIDNQEREIHRHRVNRVDTKTLARHDDRTRTSIDQLAMEVRIEQILNQPLDFIDAPEFHGDGADKMILEPVPASHSEATQAKPPRGLSAYFSGLYAYPLLTAEQEIYYFRKMNYLKFNASQIRERLNTAESKMRDVDEFTDLQQQADEIKRLLICSNLRLVVSIARKYVRPNVSLLELVSDGNLWLIRSIEKFDFTRGFKFSTYASASITRNFARSLSVERTQLNRFRTGSDEVFSQSPDLHEGSFTDEIVNHRQHEALMRMVSKLTVRDSEIIIARFGLSHLSRPQTLQEIGSRFGVSRERIRHMEMRALAKLRKLAKRERFDLPGFSPFGE